MIELLAHNLAPVMFLSVMGALLLGYPVALTLAAGGLIFFAIGVGLGEISPEIHLSWILLQSHPERIFGIMSNETLLAIPFFTFLGMILERTGMAEDLLETAGQIFGPLRGGVAYAVLFVGALLAATTGIVAASVIAMGLISLPVMLRYGYRPAFASGVIAASGTLAQILPPSLVLIVMADQLGQSVGAMYRGALAPSALLIALYALVILAVSLIRPHWLPALPPEARRFRGGLASLILALAAATALGIGLRHVLPATMTPELRLVTAGATAVAALLVYAAFDRRLARPRLSPLAFEAIQVLIPPLTLIFLVLGTIFLGIATPTEGGAMGATGALFLAAMRRKLTLNLLRHALTATARLSAFVMFILIGARVFGLTFYGIGGNVWIEQLLLSLPGETTGFLIFVTLLVFILGCFLDFFEIAFILVPLLAGPAKALGIDPIWFGIILSLNLQTSFLTPPFGFSLFFLRSVAPARAGSEGVSTAEIYRGSLVFVAINMAVIAAIIIWPGIVRHMPDPPAPVSPASIQLPEL
jgi:TRAP-type mannitol/chloroaromatic compound transport system permease large subunit